MDRYQRESRSKGDARSSAGRDGGRRGGGSDKNQAGRPRGSRIRPGGSKNRILRSGGGRSSGRKGARAARNKLPPGVVKQARSLMSQSGIPFGAALRVVQGKATLNEVLQELLREEKIRKLMATHRINRALATNVALGRTDLEIVLLRRRKNETLRSNYHRSCLEDAHLTGARIAIAVHGHKKLLGKVEENEKYAIRFRQDSDTEAREIHKTEIKFAYDPDQYRQIKKFIKIDNKVRAKKLGPILRPRERHHFKNLTLQQALDAREEVQVTTLEGDVLRGHVEWFGRWEFGLKVKGGARVTVFRHAVYDLRILSR